MVSVMINNQQQTFLSVRSTTYITRSDAEMADMSNPNGDIYACDIHVDFLHKLRAERRFDDVEALGQRAQRHARHHQRGTADHDGAVVQLRQQAQQTTADWNALHAAVGSYADGHSTL